MIVTYAGVGSIKFRGSILGNISRSYKFVPGTTLQFYYLDFGSIGESPINPIDHGAISVLAYNDSNYDWGYITITSRISPYGDFKLSSITQWTVHKAWVGTGQIFERGRGITRLVAPYIVTGTVRLDGAASTFYVPSVATQGILPLRSNTTVLTTKHEQGSGTLSAFSGTGEVVAYSPDKVQQDSHQLFHINGSAADSFHVNWNSYGTVGFSGQLVEKHTDHYVGYGSLPTFSGGADTLTKHYSLDSEEIFEYNDYGSITTTTNNYFDYGEIIEEGVPSTLTGFSDYEYIWQTFSRYPMGLFPIGGTASVVFTPSWIGSGTIKVYVHGIGKAKPKWNGYVRTKIQGAAKTNFSLLSIGSGTLFNFASADENRTFGWTTTGSIWSWSGAAESIGVKPIETKNLFDITGLGRDSLTFNPPEEGTEIVLSGTAVEKYGPHYHGSGDLPNIGSLVERRTYHYSSTSDDIFEYGDYGSITTGNDYFDYGGIIEGGVPSTIIEFIDYEYIWRNFSNYAMGDITIGGDTHVTFTPSWNGSGTVRVGGTGRARIKPRWVAYVRTKIQGAAKTNFSLLHIGSGRLWNFSSGEERRTYGWQTTGSIWSWSGAAEVVGANTPDITTLFNITGISPSSFTPNWNSQGTIPFTGTAVEKYGPHYHGSGVLYDFSEVKDSRVFDYNGSSIDWFEYRDYGSAAPPINQYFDCGHIELPQTVSGIPGNLHEADGIEDYQWIIAPDQDGTVYPFGGLHITGDAYAPFAFKMPTVFEYDRPADINISGFVVVFTPPIHYGQCLIGIDGAAAPVLTTSHYHGSGDLYALNGAAVTTSVIDISGGLFQIDGVVNERTSDAEQGSGVIFSGGFIGEATTWKIPPSRDADILLGSAAKTNFSLLHVGSGDLSALDGAAESSLISTTPAGPLYRIGGVVNERTVNITPEGSGVIFSGGFGGEATTWKIPPTRDADILIGSAAKTNFSLLHVGSGDLSAIGGAVESSLTSITPAGSLCRIGGVVDESFTPTSYIGSGVIFSGGFIGESTTWKIPPSRDADILVGGTRQSEKISAAEVGTGILYGLSGASVNTSITSISGGLFQIDGVGVVRTSDAEQGSGVIFSGGFIGEATTWKIPPSRDADIIIGSAAKTNFSLLHVGSGDLSAIGGAAVTTSITGISGGLFQIDGVVNERTANITEGSGVIFSGGFIGEATTWKIPPSRDADIIIGSAAKTNFSLLHVGSGDLSAIGGAAVTTSITGISGGLFQIDGVVNERTANITEGSGVIFSGGFGGEATTWRIPPTRDADILLGGTRQSEKTAAAEVGTGSLYAIGGAAESSLTSTTPTGPLYRIGGVVNERTTDAEQGSGVIFSGGFIGEATTWKIPPSRDADIIIGGTRQSEKTAAAEVGTGSLYAIGGAAESSLTSTTPTGPLYRIGGVVTERTSDAEQGSGVIFSGGFIGEATTWKIPPSRDADIIIGSAAKTNFSPLHVGSGDLYAIGGAAESITVVAAHYTPSVPLDITTISATNINNDPNTTLTNCAYWADSGTGTGTGGGFDIGSHIRFGDPNIVFSTEYNKPREVELELDLRNVERITIHAIRGNGSNGGESPGGTAENLYIKFGNDQPAILVAYNDTSFDSLNTVDVNVPEWARVKNSQILIVQYNFSTSSTTRGLYDHYGVKSIDLHQYTFTSTTPVGALYRIGGVGVVRTSDAEQGSGVIFSGGFIGEATTWKIPPSRDADIIIGSAAKTNFSLLHVGSGDLSAIGGAAVTTSITGISGGLFQIDGVVTERITDAEQGSGVIFSGGFIGEATTWKIPPSRDADIIIGGVVDESFTPAPYIGSGSLKNFSGAAESLTVSPDETQLLFSIIGAIDTPLRTFAEFSSGTIPITGSAYYSLSDVYAGEGVIFSGGFGGEATTWRIPPIREAHILLGGFATERTSFNPPDITTNIHIFGEISDPLLTFAEQPEVRVEVSGVANTAHVDVFAGEGVIFSGGFGGEATTWRIPPIREAHILLGGTRQSEKTTTIEIGEGRLYGLSGASVTTSINGYSGGLFTIFGYSAAAASISEIGDGIFSTFSGAAESTSIIPPTHQVLFSISGLSTYTITRNEIGDGNIWVDPSALVYYYIPKYPGYCHIKVAGEGYITRTRDWVGEGVIFSGGFGGEATTWKIPPSRDADILVGGSRLAEKTTTIEIGEGRLYGLSGASVTTSVIDISGGLFQIDGVGYITRTRDWVGAGVIFSNGFGGESTTIKLPLMREAHILFGGTRQSEKTTTIEIGEGRLYSLIGEAIGQYIPHWTGSGSVEIDGVGYITRTRDWVGEGVIFSGGFGGESTTWKIPPMREAHILLGGSRLAEKTTTIEIGEGRLYGLSGASVTTSVTGISGGLFQLDGIAYITRTRDFVGTGSLFGIDGAAESFTVIPPEQTTLFEISGVLAEKTTVSEIGYGRLWGWGGSAEAIAFSPDEEQVLFYFVGAGVETVVFDTQHGSGVLWNFSSGEERRTYSHAGDGSATVFGIADESVVRDYVGIGTTQISGFAIERFVRAPYQGKTEVAINGDASIRVSYDQVGSGVIFSGGFGGEATTWKIPPTRDADILINGNSSNSITKDYIVDAETIDISGIADESFIRSTYSGDTEVVISVEAIESTVVTLTGECEVNLYGEVSGPILTYAERGTGSLWSWNRLDEKVAFAYDGYAVIKVFGKGNYNPPEGYHRAYGVIHITGHETKTILNKYTPPRTYGWIV